MILAAFDLEEQGSLGSLHFVQVEHSRVYLLCSQCYQEFLIPRLQQTGAQFTGAFILDSLLQVSNCQFLI